MLFAFCEQASFAKMLHLVPDGPTIHMAMSIPLFVSFCRCMSVLFAIGVYSIESIVIYSLNRAREQDGNGAVNFFEFAQWAEDADHFGALAFC